MLKLTVQLSQPDTDEHSAKVTARDVYLEAYVAF